MHEWEKQIWNKLFGCKLNCFQAVQLLPGKLNFQDQVRFLLQCEVMLQHLQRDAGPPGQPLPHPHYCPLRTCRVSTKWWSGWDWHVARVRDGSCAQTRDVQRCYKVPGMTQTRCTPLPQWNVIPMQSLAVLFPLVCSSSQLSFLQLLLLEGALESPGFAELLKVVSENTARNLFHCSFSKSRFWGVWVTGLGLFLQHCPKENKPRTVILSAALISSNGMTAEASRCKPKPELNQTTMVYTAQVKEYSQPRSCKTSRCNFTTANRDFSRAPTTTAHHETLSGHVYLQGGYIWIKAANLIWELQQIPKWLLADQTPVQTPAKVHSTQSST